MLNIVKNTTLPGLFDLLAPHSCRGCGRIGAALCERCKNYIISEHAGYHPNLPDDLPPTFVLGHRTGLVGTMVHDLKYHSARALTRSLAELLDATLPEIRGRVVLVPLPTNSKHIRARGLDHTLLIAKHLAKLRHYQLEKILLRAKTPPKSALPPPNVNNRPPRPTLSTHASKQPLKTPNPNSTPKPLTSSSTTSGPPAPACSPPSKNFAP